MTRPLPPVSGEVRRDQEESTDDRHDHVGRAAFEDPSALKADEGRRREDDDPRVEEGPAGRLRTPGDLHVLLALPPGVIDHPHSHRPEEEQDHTHGHPEKHREVRPGNPRHHVLAEQAVVGAVGDHTAESQNENREHHGTSLVKHRVLFPSRISVEFPDPSIRSSQTSLVPYVRSASLGRQPCHPTKKAYY